VTVIDLKPNSQDTSAFYLGNIYQLQLLADSNASRPSIPVTPVTPPPFSPPTYVIWVNSLWFLSLVISLTCALLATLVQQWARRYLRITQRPRYSPHDRARIRAFFAHGVERMRFSWVVETIPTLIHVSLFLFFVGLLVYLFNVNHTVFVAVVWWVAVSAATYILITFMPILRLDSPYYAPLSSLAFRVYTGVLGPTFLILGWLVCFSSRASEFFFGLSDYYSRRCIRGMKKIAEMVVRNSSAAIDGLVLQWTFDALDEDRELDQFFDCIHGFLYSSNRKVIEDPASSLAKLRSFKFSSALVAFLNRTLSSNSVSKSDKIRRFVMCVKVADATRARAFRNLFNTFVMNQDLLQSVEVGHLLRSKDGRSDQEIGLCAQAIVADIIANVEERDDRWIALAAEQFGKSESDIRRYLAHGNDSVLLANWIHMARQLFYSLPGIDQYTATTITRTVIQSLSIFDIRNTLPELRRDFCTLWNEIIPEAQKGRVFNTPSYILIQILDHYIDLHQGTDDVPTASFHRLDPTSYPLCRNPGHPLPLNPALTSSDNPDRSISHIRVSPENTIPVSSEHAASHSPTSQHETIITPHTISPLSTSILPVLSSRLMEDFHSPTESSVNESDRPRASSSSPLVTGFPLPSN
jgi:Family of unknown function (DUF6535)